MKQISETKITTKILHGFITPLLYFIIPKTLISLYIKIQA